MHDFKNLRYITAQNEEIPLTEFENRTLAVLLKGKGDIVTKEKLCKEVYNQNLDSGRESSIRDLIKKLRKKLKGEIEIKNRHGFGYYILEN